MHPVFISDSSRWIRRSSGNWLLVELLNRFSLRRVSKEAPHISKPFFFFFLCIFFYLISLLFEGYLIICLHALGFALIRSDEGRTKVMSDNEGELPDLEETTWNYFDSVCTTLQRGEHPAIVPFPADDWTYCNLVLKMALAWYVFFIFFFKKKEK